MTDNCLVILAGVLYVVMMTLIVVGLAYVG